MSRRALELFEEAVERPPAERPAFLGEACGTNAELRRDVERLLEADARDGEFLAEPLTEVRVEPAGDGGPLSIPKPRLRIGDFETLGKLGQGGTSTVYLARRSGADDDERVAIKLLEAKGDSSLASRLREEARLLGQLRHPAIARLLEVGQTEEGIPFLVMEHVPGMAIDQHCDRRELSVEERIEVFLAVCDGVAAAHRSLVVHRDLKPGNILVGPDGQPKLVDFGLARLLDPSGRADPTAGALRFLTLNYASPEHLNGGALTTASDAYSLGVVLYQLLTGARPYDWSGRPLLDVLQALSQLELRPPSRAVGDDEAGARAAADRGTTPAALRARLGGDLDRIVLKALSIDPARRYDGPAALADDLRREREGRPVLARPSSIAYRTERFLRRRRWVLAPAAIAVAATVAAAVLGVAHSRRLAVERDLARAAEARAGRVIEFLVESWTPSDPLQGGRLDAAGKELLSTAVGRLETVDDPALQAQLRHTLGVILGHVGELEEAATLLGQAFEARRRLGDDDGELDSELELAWLLRQRGSLDEAESHARAVLERSRQPGAAGRRAQAATVLGEILSAEGRHDEAERRSRDALALHLELYGERHPEVANDLNNLAMLLYRAGRPAAAAEAARRCLELSRRMPEINPAEIANVAHNLGVIVMAQGDLEASGRHLEEALALRLTAFGPDHQAVANSLNSLALLAAERGDLATAEREIRRVLDIDRRAVGPDHEWTLAAEANLVEILDLSGQVDAAVAQATETLRRSREHLPSSSSHLLFALTAAGSALLDAGQLAASGALLREAAEDRRRSLPRESPDRLLSELGLARWQVASGEAPAAAAALAPLLPSIDRAFGAESWQAGWARCLLADARAAAGAWPDALSAARDGHRLLSRLLPAGNYRLDVATSVLGLARVASGDAGGLAMLSAARESLERRRGRGSLSVRQARDRELRNPIAKAAPLQDARPNRSLRGGAHDEAQNPDLARSRPCPDGGRRGRGSAPDRRPLRHGVRPAGRSPAGGDRDLVRDRCPTRRRHRRRRSLSLPRALPG